MTEYIEPDDVDELVESEGWIYRDRGLLLSALAAPLPVFGEEVHPGLLRKAAVLMRAVNRDHPLVDGNKRLSWYVTVAFLAINDVDLRPGSVDEANAFIRRVAGGDVTLTEMEQWIAARI